MKILMLVANPYLPDIRVEREARSLLRCGYEITILARSSVTPLRLQKLLPEYEDYSGIKVIRLSIKAKRRSKINDTLYYLKYIIQSTRIAKRLDADVYHCHDIYTLPIGALLKILTKKPVIYDSHEFYARLHFPRKGFSFHLMNIVERFLILFVDWIVTVNDVLANRYRNMGKKVAVVMNCPDLSMFKSQEQSNIKIKYGIEEGDFVILYHGILSSDRGLDILVSDIASSIEKEVPNTKIFIVGDGGILDKLKRIANKNVIFAGYVPYENLPNFLSVADVGVIIFQPNPNNLLASPNKLFEYMSFGIPVVASNFPVIANILYENKCGILVDPTNSKEIANAIIYLLKNEEERKTMGINGKKISEIKYNWTRQEHNLLNLYISLRLSTVHL